MIKRLVTESGIYRIKNKVNGAVYIGQAINIRMRVSHHRSLLKQGKHTNKQLQEDWQLFGEEAFSVKVIKKVAKKNLTIHERNVLHQHIIDGYFVYNVSLEIEWETIGN
jgi:group I intron endonuclease